MGDGGRGLQHAGRVPLGIADSKESDIAHACFRTLDRSAMTHEGHADRKDHMDDWFRNMDLLKKLWAPLAFTSFISSIAGIALMLRMNKTVSKKDVTVAVFSSCAACAIVFMLLHDYLVDRAPSLLYGVSCLAGAGGASTLDLLLIMLRNWSVKKGLLKKTDTEKKE